MTATDDLAAEPPMEQARTVRSPRRSILTRVLPLTGLALLLAGCASGAPLDTLEPRGPEAESIDVLSNWIFAIAGVVFVLVMGAILYMIVRFRAKDDDAYDEELPEQTHGNLKLELGWTILPAALLGVVSVFTMVVLFDLADQPEDAIEIGAPRDDIQKDQRGHVPEEGWRLELGRVEARKPHFSRKVVPPPRDDVPDIVRLIKMIEHPTHVVGRGHIDQVRIEVPASAMLREDATE